MQSYSLRPAKVAKCSSEKKYPRRGGRPATALARCLSQTGVKRFQLQKKLIALPKGLETKLLQLQRVPQHAHFPPFDQLLTKQ